jgi:hypothetical protein
MNTYNFAFFSVSLLFMTSCGTNVFQSESTNQPHAVLKPEVTVGNFIAGVGTTQILEIDGQNPSFWRMNDTFRVAPGKHSVGLIGRERAFNSMTVLNFNATNGKTYIAKSDQAGGLQMKFWIEEKGSKNVVATSSGNLRFSPRSTYTPIFVPIVN